MGKSKESDTYREWLGSKLAEKCLNNLKKHGFDACFVPATEDARLVILEMVSGYDTFGFGGSDTTRSLKIIEALKRKKKTIYDHWQAGLTKEQDLKIRLQQGRCDCFFCSANAVSATGEIVNMDGIGNRNNSMTFGPKKVVIVVGINKLTPDLESAIARVRNIAAPMRAKSLGLQTPCAETGVCNDCNAPQRICRITTILHRKPMQTDVSVIIVNQVMGY